MDNYGVSPQTKDRLMQVSLAQARGMARNGDLLRQAIDLMLEVRREKQGSTAGDFVMQGALIQTLSAVAEALEQLQITYAVTGSIASGIHGEPVMSMDVDLIIVAAAKSARALAELLSPRFYAPIDMLQDAAARNGFANVVDNQTGLKADLSFVDPSTYPGTALLRRQSARIGTSGPEFWFVAPEDIILMKLLWRKETRSTKQWDNALSVARVKGTRMDWKYLFEQALALGIEDDLVKLRDEAGI